MVIQQGCINTSRGPWKVKQKGKDGKQKESLRYPSERERHNNQSRESRRRRITTKIFEGLLKYGNFDLPKHPAGRNELLKALCKEAGWIVDDNGNTTRKEVESKKILQPFGSPVSLKAEEVNLELTLALPSNC